MNKVAFITGITGQDGSYLAELLTSKNYTVHGLLRRPLHDPRTSNLHAAHDQVSLHYGDLTDGNSLTRIIDKIAPDEIYNLAAQSHVAVSFDAPEVTSNTNALGTLRLLQSVLHLGAVDRVKFYQASTSEMFGNSVQSPQTEQTPFTPASPYGIAKLYAHMLTENYRHSYNMFACNGILFNHESPRRGELFVTRKITLAFTRIAAGENVSLDLGNLDSLRDWGHAKDYVEAMWMMLQQPAPDDYVIASGKQHSVRDFCQAVAQHFNIPLIWSGAGVQEEGRHGVTGKVLIKVNPNLYRPLDVVNLIGDATKARNVLGWKPTYSFQDLVQDMCEHDMKRHNAVW